MKKIIAFIGTLLFIIFLTALIQMKNTPEAILEKTPKTTAVIVTNLGDITVELYPELAPETVKNFTTLAKDKKYDGVPFHRIIKDFMIQTGDFENQNGTGGYSYQGPGTSIPDEFHRALTHTYGALSMANRGANTGGSQFFIVQKSDGTSWLDGKHAVFGHVTEGMEVVESIAALETDSSDRPLEEARIEKVEFPNGDSQ